MNRKDKAVFSWSSHGIRSLIFLLLAGSWNMAASQQLQREVIGNAGGSYADGSMRISWTVGEPVIKTIDGGTFRVIQGFEQPMTWEQILTSLPIEVPSIRTTVWPNPATDMVFFLAELDTETELWLEVYSINGVRLHHERSSRLPAGAFHYELDVRNWPAAEYIWCLRAEEAMAVGKIIVSGIR